MVRVSRAADNRALDGRRRLRQTRPIYFFRVSSLAKLIFLVLGLLLAYWILKSYRRKVDRKEQPPPAGGEEDMVRCVQCGVHLPRSESLTAGGKYFCGAEHQRLHQKSG